MEFYFSDANIAKSAFMQVRFYHTSLDTVNMQFGAWNLEMKNKFEPCILVDILQQ